MNQSKKTVPDVESIRYKGTPEKPDIKIFVSHRIDLDSETIDNHLYIPVRCGAVFDERENVEMLGDDTGENISEKRMSFCEFTVLYWAWKNVEADYYGLCHYRRYISFYDKELPNNALNQGVVHSLSKATVEQYKLNDEIYMANQIMQWDIVAPNSYSISDITPDSTCKSIRDNWEKYVSSYIRHKDFELLLDLIKKHSPEYYKDALKYMAGTKFMGFNCFVMKKELFNKMCEFIFPIMFEYDDTIDKEHFSSTQNRSVGYVGEWLFSIWMYDQLKKNIRFCQKQLIVATNTEKPENIGPVFKKNYIPIVMTLTDTNRSLISVSLKSLINNISSEENYDVIFLQRSTDSDRWTNEVRKGENDKLKSMVSTHNNVSVRFFDPKDKIGILDIPYERNEFSEETFYIALLPWLLPKYNKFIYLSENILIMADILELFNIDMEDKCIGATRDVFFSAKLNGYAANFKKLCEKNLKLTNLYDYISLDLVVFDAEKCRAKLRLDDIICDILQLKEKFELNDFVNKMYDSNIKFLPQEWAKISCCDADFYKFIEYLPEQLDNELKEAKNAKGILLKGTQGFTIVPQLQSGQLFWNIAKMTPFYEQLVFQTTNYLPFIFDLQCRVGVFDTRSNARKVADKICPPNTWRRKIAKVIAPKGSRRWNLCKGVFYFFKPKYRPKSGEEKKGKKK